MFLFYCDKLIIEPNWKSLLLKAHIFEIRKRGQTDVQYNYGRCYIIYFLKMDQYRL